MAIDAECLLINRKSTKKTHFWSGVEFTDLQIPIHPLKQNKKFVLLSKNFKKEVVSSIFNKKKSKTMFFPMMI